MNFGVFPGFTSAKQVASAAASSPAGSSLLRVVNIDSSMTNIINADNVGALLLVATLLPRTETIGVTSIPMGAQIKVAQWGISQLTIAAGFGVTLRVPSGRVAKTRDLFSVVTLVRVSDKLNEWLLLDDLATI